MTQRPSSSPVRYSDWASQHLAFPSSLREPSRDRDNGILAQVRDAIRTRHRRVNGHINCPSVPEITIEIGWIVCVEAVEAVIGIAVIRLC